MPELIIPLNQVNVRGVRRFRIMQAVNACCFLAVALLRPQLDSTAIAIGSYGIILLLVATFWPLFQTEYQLILDDLGMRGRIAWRKSVDFSWDKVAKANLGILQLEVTTTDNKSFNVNFGNLTYQQHQELKPRLQEMLAARGLLIDSKASSRVR